jgi:hypothetical protein
LRVKLDVCKLRPIASSEALVAVSADPTSLVVSKLLLLLQGKRLHVPALYPNAVDKFDGALDYMLGFAVVVRGGLLFYFDDAITGEISFLQISRKADIGVLSSQFAATDWGLWVGSEGKHYSTTVDEVIVLAERSGAGVSLRERLLAVNETEEKLVLDVAALKLLAWYVKLP